MATAGWTCCARYAKAVLLLMRLHCAPQLQRRDSVWGKPCNLTL